MTTARRFILSFSVLAWSLFLGLEQLWAPSIRFRRGDVDDGGTVFVLDAITFVGRVFGDNNLPEIKCQDAWDINDDGSIDISDPIYLLYHLFLGGPAVPPPTGEACGLDPTEDGLSCGVTYETCPDDPEGEENFLGMRFVRIPAGTFKMGSPATERGREWDERQHVVTITCDFYLQATEVTQRQYREIMSRNPSSCQGPEFGDNLERPVDSVSWIEAWWFCRKLSEKEFQTTGQQFNYRLPTEAEWEYACRAGTETRFWFGDLLDCPDQIGYCPKGDQYEWWAIHMNLSACTYPVGGKSKNPFGLHDIHSNVGEWCYDWYAPYPREPVVNPIGPKDGTQKVTRGHGILDFKSGRSAARLALTPNNAGLNTGFRVVREIPGCHLPITE